MSIRVYKTRTCGVCNNLLSWLRRKGHKATEVYIDDDAQLQKYVLEKSGGFYQVPLTVIEKDGEEYFVSGGNIPKINGIITS